MKFAKRTIFFFAFIFFTVVTPSSSHAEKVESTNDRLTVTPAKLELSGDPGTSVTQALKITNEDSQPTILAVSAQPFTISGDSGEVMLSQKDSNQSDNLYKWIMFDWQAMQLASKESKILTFRIDIPKEKAVGGHYASIIISSDRLDKQDSDPVGTSRVVSLVMLSISGNINDSAKVDSFTVKPTLNKNYEFNLIVKNNGNNHIKPQGKIVISNLLGHKVDEVDLVGENTLPGVKRRMITSWEPGKFLFGRYTATVVSTYGSTIPELSLSAVTTFWVIRWPAILLLLLTIIFIIGFIYYLRYVIKK